MSLEWIVLMVIAAVGMLYARKKHRRGATWGMPVTIVCGILVLVFAAMNLVQMGGAGASKLRSIEQSYRRIAGEKMGVYLASQQDVEKAVMMVAPGTKDEPRTKKMIEGERKGLGENVQLLEVVTPQIPESIMENYKERYVSSSGGNRSPEGEGEDPEAELTEEEIQKQIPVEMWFNAERMDQALSEYKDRCDVVISAMGFPSNMSASSVLSGSAAPAIAIVRGVSRLRGYKQAIQEGRILAVVVRDPDSPVETEKKPPRNLDKAFAKRYLLVTPDNVEQMSQEYNRLFE